LIVDEAIDFNQQFLPFRQYLPVYLRRRSHPGVNAETVSHPDKITTFFGRHIRRQLRFAPYVGDLKTANNRKGLKGAGWEQVLHIAKVKVDDQNRITLCKQD
jgi:hypothetical protein